MTWLLFETEGNQIWLIDCGDIVPVINKVGDKEIVGVLLTHAHFDHIYGLPELINRFPECNIYTNGIGRLSLADARQNMSFYHETPLTVEEPQVQICKGGDFVKLYDNINAKVYETPGHNPSCLTFEVNDYLFTGDAYIPEVKVVTKLPKGDRKLAEKSIKRIKSLAEGKKICPGHGEIN